MFNLGVDVMSGDNPPSKLIEGAVEAFKKVKARIHLIGDPSLIEAELKSHNLPPDSIKIIPSKTIIDMDEHPAQACRTKPDSSLMVGFQAMKEGKLDAFFSPGNTGATMAGGLLSVGRLKGVKRPAIAILLPTKGNWTLLLDAGANMDCQPKYLRQFAIMGQAYYKYYFNQLNPRVGLLNVGEEDTKGNELIQKTHKEIEKLPLNIVGNIEPADIIENKAEVVVCDGFAGNILLKSFEAVASFFLKSLKQVAREKWYYTIGALMLKPGLSGLKENWNAKKIGAAPLLGLGKPTFIGHGNTDAESMEAAIKTMVDCLNRDVNEHIQEEIKKWG